MTYRSSLQLFFDTAAFKSNGSSKSAIAKEMRGNSPISLTYVAQKSPLTTSNRFFLQFMRAQLHCLCQSQTTAKDLLNFVSSGWDMAQQIAETVHQLQLESVVDVSILSDERLGITVNVLLPKVKTKVSMRFELAAAVGTEEGLRMSTTVNLDARVIYGEKYNERKMHEFLTSRVGTGVKGWESAVRELKGRLVTRGRK